MHKALLAQFRAATKAAEKARILKRLMAADGITAAVCQEALAAKNATVIRAALEAIRLLPTAEAVDLLVSRLHHAQLEYLDYWRRVEPLLLDELRRLWAPAVRDIVRWCGFVNPDARKDLSVVLAGMGPEVVEMLLEIIKEGDDTDTLLPPFPNDPREALRMAAIAAALGHLGDYRAYEPLSRALQRDYVSWPAVGIHPAEVPFCDIPAKKVAAATIADSIERLRAAKR